MNLSLAVDTLDKSRPALEDLRVYDPMGNETSYSIERPVPASKITQTSRSFQVSLNPAATSITLETGLAQPIDGVTLETPANSFIKSVRIESSADGKRWHSIAEGQPIFRQPDGASQLRLPLQTVSCSWLRL